MPKSERPPAWLWLSLLSLDAPLIALVWQDFLYRCYPTVLHTAGRAVLGLSVWAIYLADRLLDIRHHPSARTMQHRFYRRFHTPLRLLLALVICLDAVIASTLRPAVIQKGILVAAGVFTYLCVFPLTGWTRALWKKPLAAVLFTAGTFVVEWTGAHLLWPAVAFCALCLANLITVEHWSRDTSAKAAPVWLWPVLLAVCIAVFQGRPAFSLWFAAIVASAAGLYSLTRWGRVFSREARCVLADAVLLSPLLIQTARAMSIHG